MPISGRSRMSISMIHLNKKAQSMSGGLNKTPLLQRQTKVTTTPNAKKPPPSPMRRPLTTSTPNAGVQRRASAAADMRRGKRKTDVDDFYN